MFSQAVNSLCRVLTLACVAITPIALAAQDTPNAPTPQASQSIPATPANSAGFHQDYTSKADIFAGYSYLAPKGTVQVPQPDGTVIPYSYNAVDVGGLFSGAYYFNKNLGLQLEYGYHEWGDSSSNYLENNGEHGNDDGFQTVSGGVIFRFPSKDITPFIHALVGGARVDGPDHNAYTWGVDLTAGGGMDYNTPLLDHHLAIRVFQADYEYMHADFGSGVYGGRANIDAARLSAGLVFGLGRVVPPPPPQLACSVNPTSGYPGDPITATATATAVNPKWYLVYNWSGDGVTGNGPTATINTTNLNPGTYTVKGAVKVGKKGKEGLKPYQNADCSAQYTVKEFEPPTISCSASPSTIKPGDTSTITSTGVSPQNRPLTYTYSAASGTVSGNGTTATYNSAGAPTGTVEVTCTVADDKGHTVSSTTSVTIVAPPPPPAPHTQTLCSLDFEKDKARPTRVDNEAKACLDEIALNMQNQADAKAVLVGYSDAKEKATTEKQQAYAAKHKKAKVTDFAAQRAINAKDYLVTEKGIDASRISVATGTDDAQKVNDYLVPSGATFGSDIQGTTPVDESTLKPEVRKPLPQRRH
jgi:outer membrane protein OmpA-like peptidoglycan-associated protein